MQAFQPCATDLQEEWAPGSLDSSMASLSPASATHLLLFEASVCRQCGIWCLTISTRRAKRLWSANMIALFHQMNMPLRAQTLVPSTLIYSHDTHVILQGYDTDPGTPYISEPGTETESVSSGPMSPTVCTLFPPERSSSHHSHRTTLFIKSCPLE